MRRGRGGERARFPLQRWAASSTHGLAPHHRRSAPPGASAQGRDKGDLIPPYPLPNLIRERGGALTPNCGGDRPAGSPCETRPLPGKCKGELLGWVFLRKTWQRYPRRGFEDVFLPMAHRLGQSGMPQRVTTRPVAALAQLPAWREGTSASPSQHFSGTNRSDVVGVLQVITFF